MLVTKFVVEPYEYENSDSHVQDKLWKLYGHKVSNFIIG